MKQAFNNLSREEDGRFAIGNSGNPNGRPPAIPKDIKYRLIKNIDVTCDQLIEITEGKVLVLHGKEYEYNHFFWLESLKLRYAYVYGKPSVQVVIDDKRGMTDEEKLARSGNIDDLALMRAKDKLNTIEVNSESK